MSNKIKVTLKNDMKNVELDVVYTVLEVTTIMDTVLEVTVLEVVVFQFTKSEVIGGSRDFILIYTSTLKCKPFTFSPLPSLCILLIPHHSNEGSQSRSFY